MKYNRVKEVLTNKEKVDIFFDERPVWIQGVNNNIAKVGFIDNFGANKPANSGKQGGNKRKPD